MVLCAGALLASLPATAQEAQGAAPTMTLAMSSDAVLESLTQRFGVAQRVAPAGGGPEMGFATPTLRVFNATGHELLSLVGYDAAAFPDTLASVTSGPGQPVAEALTLTSELSFVRTVSGEAVDLEALPDADYTLVQYGTESCAPCHEEEIAVAAFIAASPQLRVNWITVEIDFGDVAADEALMSSE